MPRADGASDIRDVEPDPEAKAGCAFKLTKNAPSWSFLPPASACAAMQ